MNCNYKTIKSLNKNERDRLKSEITKWNKEFLEGEANRLRNIMVNNFFKIFCISLNETLGLGKSRIEKVFDYQQELIRKLGKDYDEWYLIDKQCKRILGEETYYKYFTDAPFKM